MKKISLLIILITSNIHASLQDFAIFKTKYWQLNLYSNQSYIGSCYLTPLYNHEDTQEGIEDISSDVDYELHMIIMVLEKALKRAFGTNIINIWHGFNLDEPICATWNFVPRYKNSIFYKDNEFKDLHWSSSFDLTKEILLDKNSEVCNAIILKLINAIKPIALFENIEFREFDKIIDINFIYKYTPIETDNENLVRDYCFLCEDIAQDDLAIFEGNYWRFIVNSNQYYLGASMLTLKRHISSLSQLSLEEQVEYLTLRSCIKQILRNCFGAINIDMLYDTSEAYKSNPARPHVHWHFIPRYKNSVTYGDETISYEHENFRRPFDCSAKRILELDDDLMDNIVTDITETAKDYIFETQQSANIIFRDYLE